MGQTDANHILLVTGTLAAPATLAIAKQIAKQQRIKIDVMVLKIQVAALMTAHWVNKKLNLPAGCLPHQVILPGYCRGDCLQLAERLGVPVIIGPRHIGDLPHFLGQTEDATSPRYDPNGPFDIQIIAEINDAAHLPIEQIIAQAKLWAGQGADIIDLGCDPQADRPAWTSIGHVVALLGEQNIRVSVDSFHPKEIQLACQAGVELVLSVNKSNRDIAKDWGATVVVIPDDPHTLAGLDQTVNLLEKHNVSYILDPIIEPIGFGFAGSLGRYIQVRQRYPQASMMMGVGNITEMSAADSAGMNLLLMGFCQELGIDHVLSTQVIPWAQSCVGELDVARRMVHYALHQKTVPKHDEGRLVMLRDGHLRKIDPAMLNDLAKQLTDKNIRLFADNKKQQLHLLSKGQHVIGDDPFLLFDQLHIQEPSHAFYLGYELAKAKIALTLGKNYEQDVALDWGLLTQEEKPHHARQKAMKQNNHPNNTPTQENA